jgi:DNA-directed RNA polymerase subunit RPC12/RpoP
LDTTSTNSLPAAIYCKKCKKEFPQTLGPSETPYVFCRDCSIAYCKNKPSDEDVKKAEDVLTRAKTGDTTKLMNNTVTLADVSKIIE